MAHILVLQYLHVADNSCARQPDDPDRDKLFKIRPMLNHLVHHWQTAFHPRREVSTNESIVAFEGRSHMVVYKSKKPHKWGINAWVLADARSGYVWNMDLYTGRKSTTEVGMTKTMVTSLCTPIYGLGHHVYMYFSLPALFQELRDNDVGACGTLRVNRTGAPDRIKTTKLKKPGPPVVERDADDTLYMIWFDKCQVSLMSTIHNSMTFQKTVRSRGVHGNQ